jgi:hypothetical protein
MHHQTRYQHRGLMQMGHPDRREQCYPQAMPMAIWIA